MTESLHVVKLFQEQTGSTSSVDSTTKEREWPHNCHNCFMTKSSHKNLVTIGPLVAEIFKFENVYRQTHRQTTA